MNTPSNKPLGRKPVKSRRADIRKDYRLTAQLAMIASLLVVTAFFRSPMQRDDDGFDLSMVEQETVQMEEIQQTEQIERPPPPPRPPVPVEVPNDTVLEDDALDLDVSLDLDEVITDVPPPPPMPMPDEEEEEDDMEIFVVVEQMPEIIGGTQKVYEFLEYPMIARQAEMEGLVVVQVVVNTDGRPSEPVVARSAGSVLDEAAVGAVMKLTFRPGRQRGQPVRVRMAIPIRFRLRDAKG